MSTYAYLGPVGTFTEAALKKITQSSDTQTPYANVTATLDAVRNGQAEYALVPIENSVEGVVARTLDELATGTPLVITGEVTLPVSFALMVKSGSKTINRIATHPYLTKLIKLLVGKNANTICSMHLDAQILQLDLRCSIFAAQASKRSFKYCYFDIFFSPNFTTCI